VGNVVSSKIKGADWNLKKIARAPENCRSLPSLLTILYY